MNDVLMDNDWDAAWVAALDELELSVDQAEALLHASDPEPLRPWTPPVLQGPPPPQELARAHVLLERHQRVTRELAQAMAATRQQMALAAKVRQNRPDETPVYFDVQA